VVGVVQTTRYDELSESPKRYIYLPLEQSSPGQLALVARWRPGAHAGTPALESVVRSLDPQLPLVDVRTLEQLIGGSLDTQRAAGVLLAVLGGLALLLATLGIYGVMSHATMLRSKEIAIRTALGARPPDVWRLFVGEALKLCVVGAAIGAVLAVAVARLISSFLFGLSPVDVLTFLAPALVICATGSAATWLAARRGTGLFSTGFHS
jgi:putative ABC transport system permease protein